MLNDKQGGKVNFLEFNVCELSLDRLYIVPISKIESVSVCSDMRY